MVTLPAVPNVIKALLKGTTSGQPWANVHYLQYTGGTPSVANLESLASAIGAAWGTDVAPLCPASVTLTEIDCTDLTSAFAAQSSSTMSVPGSRAGTGLVVSAAMVTSLKIQFRYRGGHPRIYVPAGVQGDVTNLRLWTSAFQTAANAGMSAYLAALNAITVGGITFKMCAVSFFHGTDPTTKKPIPRTTPIVNLVQSTDVHGRVDTQRRRLGKETP